MTSHELSRERKELVGRREGRRGEEVRREYDAKVRWRAGVWNEEQRGLLEGCRSMDEERGVERERGWIRELRRGSVKDVMWVSDVIDCGRAGGGGWRGSKKEFGSEMRVDNIGGVWTRREPIGLGGERSNTCAVRLCGWTRSKRGKESTL
ncbi:hypothetical protein GOBAR_AA29127 [Gossypium barbadense]|uniref:Uncharacterized protein n=1 Tax=Gossypium barbadense TaxID=3634 RepID=A0A2P5WKE9_GOSBA|nr:hypothetical protein GOBAR_AA29127 [Gossypium barbadense]